MVAGLVDYREVDEIHSDAVWPYEKRRSEVGEVAVEFLVLIHKFGLRS